MPPPLPYPPLAPFQALAQVDAQLSELLGGFTKGDGPGEGSGSSSEV
jgi:hypothetical protein